MVSLEQTLRQTHDWAIERITLLCDEGNHDQMEDAFALEREFDEWLGSDINAVSYTHLTLTTKA